MTDQAFALIPFPAATLPGISITGQISLQKHIVELHYLLAGQTDEILLPPRAEKPGRKDDLWKMSCFEFFLAMEGQPGYWEFNMCPSGDWNVYRMEKYRRVGFKEETSIQELPFVVSYEGDTFTLDIAVDLHPILQPNQALEIGITAVIQTLERQETYWALTHPARKADFHLRESFILALAEPAHLSPQSALHG
jgi:hypothetical protein